MWWDADKIESTVTRQFVSSHLSSEESKRLGDSLAFGGGLTDDTYWDWIEEKAKRIFLILLDLGVPTQIFRVIDDSWDDHDLPIALDQVERLALTPAKDEKSEKKFFYRQYHYLLKPLHKGGHHVYQDAEIVPLDLVHPRQGLSNCVRADKVELPNQPGQVFCRRRIPLGNGAGCLAHEDFLYEINSIKHVQNGHLVSYWASYVHQGHGYVLFTPPSDFNLKSLLGTAPHCVKDLEKQARRRIIMNWILCLVDSLCFIHHRGLSHGNIKPSTILFNSDNHIFYSDFTRLNAELLTRLSDKGSFDKEDYDYAAPEQWFRPAADSVGNTALRRATFTGLSTASDNTTFSISRTRIDARPNSPSAIIHAPNPHLSPQSADIFSLGCCILELLSHLLKRQTRAFAAHRAAKHKTAGRGGAVLDSSFHKNLGQVEGWMAVLAKDARKKSAGDAIFAGVQPMLHVVARMLAANPAERPAASDVQARMYKILTEDCQIAEPHCVHNYDAWDFGLGTLKLAGSGSGDGGGEVDALSIATKRSSGGAKSLFSRHARTSSSGSLGHGTVTPVSRSPRPMSGFGGRGILKGREHHSDESDTSRRDSGGSGDGADAAAATAAAAGESRDSGASAGWELGSGLLAIQNIRLKGKSRSWQQQQQQTPLSAGS